MFVKVIDMNVDVLELVRGQLVEVEPLRVSV